MGDGKAYFPCERFNPLIPSHKRFLFTVQNIFRYIRVFGFRLTFRTRCKVHLETLQRPETTGDRTGENFYFRGFWPLRNYQTVVPHNRAGFFKSPLNDIRLHRPSSRPRCGSIRIRGPSQTGLRRVD